MADIFKIAVIAVTAALCALVIKKQSGAYASVLALAVGAFILFQILGVLEQAGSLLDELGEMAGLSPAVIAPVMKTVGVAILTKLTASLCKDSDESSIAAAVETAGAAVALAISIPLLRTVLSMITELL